jgi:hypothetical protein
MDGMTGEQEGPQRGLVTVLRLAWNLRYERTKFAVLDDARTGPRKASALAYTRPGPGTPTILQVDALSQKGRVRSSSASDGA